jgi:hypothetical protein
MVSEASKMMAILERKISLLNWSRGYIEDYCGNIVLRHLLPVTDSDYRRFAASQVT